MAKSKKRELGEVLITRAKSLGWRLGMLFVAALLDTLLSNLGLLELPDQVTLVLGLVLGEVSKYLNNKA